MIIAAEDVAVMPEFAGMDFTALSRKLEAIENIVRRYTHNNFQNPRVRFCATSDGLCVDGYSDYLAVGDTVQITESVNAGLCVIERIEGGKTYVDKLLYPAPSNVVTKVEYPPDIIEGVLNMLKWEINGRDKVGIKSETLSRHSVTYYDMDSNSVMGYPAALLGFLRPYMRARF